MEADVAKGRRDWAFSERDKVVLERESIRTLCDKLRRERDRYVTFQFTVVCIKDGKVSFLRFWKKPSIVQKKNDTSYKRARFLTEMKQKKIQNGRLRKFKMAASKKPRFPAPPILNIFSWIGPWVSRIN